LIRGSFSEIDAPKLEHSIRQLLHSYGGSLVTTHLLLFFIFPNPFASCQSDTAH
ncbi:unnamed protein product, partial [Ceratitis capitata]